VAPRDDAGSGKKGAERSTTALFIDEAGFQLLPAVARTYAPRGETPVLEEQATKEHWSVISAVTPAGQLFWQMQERAFHGPEVVRFLKHLERQFGGKLLIVWDRANIHRGEAVREFLAAGHAARLELLSLPGYAPDLNPDEGVWNWTKGALANMSYLDLPQLQGELRRTLQRLRRHPELIRSFFAHAGYG
jgi:transposase